jgi:hypothetical protein
MALLKMEPIRNFFIEKHSIIAASIIFKKTKSTGRAKNL